MKKVLIVLVLAITGVSCATNEKAFAQSGQTAAINQGGQFRVMEVKEYTSTNRFFMPPEDMRFVAFDVVIDNTNGANDIRLLSSSIELRDLEGYTYTAASSTYDLVIPSLNMGYRAIEKGDLVRGWVTIAIRNRVPLNGLRIRLRSSDAQSDWITIRHR